MAIFNDLGRKISQAGQTTAQKAKDMTDIARINSAIAEEEKRINNGYYQIGKLYVAMHSSDFEEDFSGMIAAIKESELKILNYNQQIQNIKGVIRCEKCGAEITKGFAFCSSCGNPIPKMEFDNASELVKCSGCGALNDKNMRFCMTCGKPIERMINVADDIKDDESIKVSPERVCPNCGALVLSDAVFCSSCGASLSRSSVPAKEGKFIKCGSCGAANEKNMKFCTVCGKPLEVISDAVNASTANVMKEESHEKTCPNCGMKVSGDLLFCTECGTKLS